MGSQFAWFYDVLTVIIIVVCVYFCGKKGFLRSIVSLVGYIASFLVATLAANSITPAIYNSAIQPKVVSSIEQKLEGVNVIDEINSSLNSKYGKFGVTFKESEIVDILGNSNGEAAQNIIDYVSKKAGFTITDEDADGIIGSLVSDEVNEKVRDNSPSGIIIDDVDFGNETVWSDAVYALKSGNHEMANFIERYFIRDYIMSIIRLAVLILTFVILNAIIGIVLRALKIVDKIPLVNAVNSFLGGVLGIFQGVITVFVIALAVRLLIAIGGDDMIVFNTATIDLTYLFKSFFYFGI